MSPMWVSTSNCCSIETIESNTKSPSSDAIENEIKCKNLSKMRTYLKRCENAINNINLSVMRATTTQSTTEPIDDFDPGQSCSSWYIDELDVSDADSYNESNCIKHKSNEQMLEQIAYSADDHKDGNDCVHVQMIKYVDTSIELVSMN